ncbi:Opi1-domain-containing protein [Pholiota conissans]|uniref:Opi1-domain-containing protein n=1 Tax=Pholiota conissans TaxID=109636 RepID=A0A9P5YRP9_9AGAR|nr:Opi1-domain-containing protein [Pholiota conissans]
MADDISHHSALDDQDESVRIAIKALGEMRNGVSARTESNPKTLPPLSMSSSSSSSVKSPRLSSPASSSRSRDSSLVSEASSSAPAFVSRMSSLPLLGSAMRVYEQGKASSRVVKYGAEMMESSVKAVSRPVIDRLPVNVNQLDDFACRQLDRLDRYRRPSSGADTAPTSSNAISPSSADRGRPKLRTKTLDGTAVEEDEDTTSYSSSSSSKQYWKASDRDVPSWLESSSPYVEPPPDSRASTPTQNGDPEDDEKARSRRAEASEGSERQVAQRSRWQAVLLEAGGLSAALSEESMRRLKYCLQWLQYATAHIDAQILILRDFTASLQPLPSSSSSVARRPPISEEHLRKLTAVRRDIVHTIRQVVDVVSKYTGGALPEPARTRVRGFILKLPQRWANKAGPATAGSSASSSAVAGLTSLSERDTVAAAAGHGSGALRRPGGQRRAAQRERGTGAPEPGVRSGQNSRAASPSSSPRLARAALASSRHGEPTQGDAVSASTALVASQRILVLATESLDMMRNVTSVVKESLDRADAWVGRLRTVGIQRGAQEGEDISDHDMAAEFGFPQPEQLRHRRNESTTSTAFSDPDAEHDADHDIDHEPSSPVFSSNTSTTWGSSIPSTPGGGTYTPGGGGFSSSAGAAPGTYSSACSSSGARASFEKGYAGYAGAPSPGAIPIGSMSLASRYNTPKSVAVGLPEEEEEGAEGEDAVKTGSTVIGEVRIVDAAYEDSEERGIQKMDVDV